MLTQLARSCFVALLLGTSIPSHAQEKQVAITIDDLPYVSDGVQPVSAAAAGAQAEKVNRAILKSLKRAHAPATGFVVESKLSELDGRRGEKILRQWIAGGFDLGNHTYSHIGFDALSIESFESEVVNGERTFLPLMQKAGRGQSPFFRFPNNQTGDTQEKHEALAAFLLKRGYRFAPCTIENEDYNFNPVYVQMLQHGDAAGAAKVRAAYLQYTAEEIDYYASLNRQVLGYEPPQIIVVHDNQLNGDLLSQVLQLFIDRGYRFVSLTDAEKDPVYQTPDHYVTKYGPMWGYRWARERGVKVNGSLEKEPPDWILNYGNQP